jgi:hypothetical protein
MISDDDIEAALDWLRDHAGSCAKAIAESWYMQDYRKVVKAEEMAKCNESAVNAQERHAYTSAAYKLHIELTRDAIEKEHKERFLIKAADAKIEAWRTQQSNQRAMGKVV